MDPGSDAFRSRLQGRLHATRTLVVSGPLSSEEGTRLTEQLAVMAEGSGDPIRMLWSGAPGGEIEAGLSLYDLIRWLDAPVTMLATGSVGGAKAIAFVGVPQEHRFALPHARFQMEMPRTPPDGGTAQDLDAAASAAADRRARIIGLLAEATGQSEDQIEADLSGHRTFEAEAAVAYGWVHKIVEHRRELE